MAKTMLALSIERHCNYYSREIIGINHVSVRTCRETGVYSQSLGDVDPIYLHNNRRLN